MFIECLFGSVIMFKKIIRFFKKLFHINDSVFYINGSENLLPPLSKEEEEQALQVRLNRSPQQTN